MYEGLENNPSRYWIMTPNGFLLPDGRELMSEHSDISEISHAMKYGKVVDNLVINPMRVGKSVTGMFKYRGLVEGTDEYMEAEQLTASIKKPMPISSLIPGNRYLTTDFKIIVWKGEMYRKGLYHHGGTLSVVNDRILCYVLDGDIYFYEKDVAAVKCLGSFQSKEVYSRIQPRHGNLMASFFVTEQPKPDDYKVTTTFLSFDADGQDRGRNITVMDDMICVKKQHSPDEYHALDATTLQYRKIIKTSDVRQAVRLGISFGTYNVPVNEMVLLNYCQEAEKALTNG